ncbi:MAG: protein translocase subunit SecD [bacterium]|nr:protein translocase subunit SecD [bacterium]
MSLRVKFYLVLALTVIVALLVLPREDKIFRALGIKDANLKVRQGLDLKGGANLIYQADLSKIDAKDRPTAIKGAIDVISKRVNPTGTSEVTIQTSGSDRIVVQLPGIKDTNEAINLIGKTAQLSFLEIPPAGDNAQSFSAIPTDLSGKDLKTAEVDIDPQTSKPVIRFEMKSEAVQKFADLTTRINKENGKLAILLDEQVLFNGGVSTPITDGKGQMEGFKDLKDAQKVTLLLNAGALPVPLSLVEQRTIGASLGSESVTRSIIAGLIGIFAVMIFMIAYYRLAGLVASVALTIYTLINISIFKISGVTPWPIVLTLAGIAGFILSIGMAVDANILIFERMKEEIRSGKTFLTSLDDGFKRAWTSIRDSNITTLITCVILYWFGAPIIRGFAVTLGIGVLVSMFTAITVSKTLMSLIVKTDWGQNPKLYGISKKEVNK